MADAQDTSRRHVPSPREAELERTSTTSPVAEFVRAPESTAPADESGSRRRSMREIGRDLRTDMDPRRYPSKFGPRPLIVLAALALAAGWDDAVLGVLAPEIRDDFGVSLTFVSTIAVATLVLTTIAGPAAGYLADRVHRVRLVGIGTLAGNLASVATGFAPSAGAFLGIRVGATATTMFHGPATYPLISDYYPVDHRGRVFGYLALWSRAGGLIGPLLAGGAGTLFGWRPAVVFFGLIACAISLLVFTLPNPSRGYYDRINAGADEAAAGEEPGALSWGEAWRAAASIVTVRRIWYATPFLTLAGNGMAILLPFYYSEEFGIGPFGIGMIVALQQVVAIAGLALAGRVADRLLAVDPARIMALFGAIVVANVIPLVVLIASPFLILPVLFGAFLTFVSSLISPGVSTVLSLVIPARLRGLGLQTFQPWQLPGLLLIPVVLNLTGEDLRTTFVVLIPIFAVGALIYASGASGVTRDIRAAVAASVADQEARRAKQEGRTKLLVCRDVDVTYDGTQVLFNVDFDVEEGELVALVGTNGAGKSTLLRAIAGVQEASNGAIFLDGRDITHRPPGENAADGVVFVPGGRAIFPGLTVAENLRTAAYLQRDDESWVEQQTQAVLDLFPPLRTRLDELAGNMSGGEQQMLALGQAFVMRPKILMIDELSLGLAPAVVERLLDVVRRINAAGTTVILVEQSINVALTVARRAVFLEKGRVRFDGPTDALLGRSDLVRAVFLSGTGGSGGQPLRARRRTSTDEVERVLEASDIDVSYGGVMALSGASLTVDAGQIVGIIGPNGAGKTTLLDVISGFVKPDEGAVVIAGTDATTLSPDARARIGLARSFQNATLFGSLTVRDTLAVALERKLETRSAALAAVWAPPVRRAERRVRRRVEWLIDAFALEAFADKFVTELSTGSRRIVDLACIAAAEPKLLLLDEPSSGLAQAESEALAPVVRRLVRDTGCGVVVIEHDIPLITSLADRLVAMELGTPIVEGDPQDVVGHPRVVEAYLGADRSVIERSGPLATALEAAGLNPPNKEHT